MTGKSLFPSRRVLLPFLLFTILIVVSSNALAAPGDLTVEMELDEKELEAEPQEEAGIVVFHGNVTFTQPFYQYASATITADVDEDWSVTVSPPTVSNRGEGSVAFTVSVEAPISARGGEVSSVEVVAEYSTRIGNPSVLTATATVKVKPWVGYRFNLTGPTELVLETGTTGTLRIPIRNVGNEPEYFSATVPYWYGLRPLGVTVTPPNRELIQPKQELALEFQISLEMGIVPRAYVFELVVDALSLEDGGEGATLDPRSLTAKLYVTGESPPNDPYDVWQVGDPPEIIPSWESVFGSREWRANPDVDATGAKMVYDQSEGTDRVIYLGETEGSGARRLTNGHVDHHPVFSPNGQMIAFARMPDRIIMINLNGTELLEFGSELGQVNITDWSPSGDRLLFDSGGDIYELDLSTNMTWLLAGEPVDQWGAVYSPDGSRVFYVSFEAAGDKPEIWTMLSDGAGHIQLTFNDQSERTPSVSPNGRRVAFALSEPTLSGDRVCVMNSDGSDVRFFTDRSKTVFNVRWLPNGEALVAEVGVQDSSFHDIESVLYPWEDAGFPKNDGGTDGSTPDGGVWDTMLGSFGLSVMIAIVLMIVVAVAAVVVMGRRKRARAEAAEKLIEMTGRGHEGSGPTEVIRIVPEEERFRW